MFLGPKAKTWELGLGKVGQILTVDLKKAGETQLTVDSAGFDRSCCAAAKRAPNPLLLSMVAESDVPARHSCLLPNTLNYTGTTNFGR